MPAFRSLGSLLQLLRLLRFGKPFSGWIILPFLTPLPILRRRWRRTRLRFLSLLRRRGFINFTSMNVVFLNFAIWPLPSTPRYLVKQTLKGLSIFVL